MAFTLHIEKWMIIVIWVLCEWSDMSAVGSKFLWNLANPLQVGRALVLAEVIIIFAMGNCVGSGQGQGIILYKQRRL